MKLAGEKWDVVAEKGVKACALLLLQVLRVLILDLAKEKKKNISTFYMFKFLGGCHVLI